MQNTKLPLDETGVKDWKNTLYASPENEIRNEQEFITTDLISWLILRFMIDEKQIEYAQSLGEISLEQIGRDLNEAIDNRADITLTREQHQPGRDNSKVGTSSKTYSPLQKNGNNSLVLLAFHFYYLP